MGRLRPSLAAFVAVLGIAAGVRAAGIGANAAFDRFHAGLGDVVSYTITLSGSDLSQPRRLPSPDFSAFKVVGGPAAGSSTQISIANGRMSQSRIFTYTWELLPQKEGTLAVPPTTVELDGQRVQVSGAELTVGGAPSPAQSSPASSFPGFPPGMGLPPRAWPDGRSPWDGGQGRPRRNPETQLQVRTLVDDTDAWLGQEIVVTHALDFTVSVAEYSPVAPAEFPGFAKLQREVTPKGRVMNDATTGETFQRAPLARWALVPLAAGEKELPSQAYSLTIRGGDDFFPLFGGTMQRVVKATAPMKVNVRPLPPDAPASFAGAVGSFQVEASLTAATLNQGDGTTLNIRISGKGSFQGVTAPHLTLPPGLRLFDAEAKDATQADEDGHTQGSKTFAYPILVTEAGHFELPGLEWSFFDPRTGRYVTRQTAPLHVDAAPVAGTVIASPGMAAAATPVTLKGHDIHHVRASLGPRPEALRRGEIPRWFWPSAGFGPLVALAYGIAGLARRFRRTDPAAIRVQRALRRARDRVKKARAHARAGQHVEAADAAARAVGGFVADRLLLGEGEPSPAEAGRAITEKMGPELGARVQGFLSECDYARFASQAGAPLTDPRTLAEEADRLLDELTSLPAALGEAA